MIIDLQSLVIVLATEHERLVNKRIAEWHVRQALAQRPRAEHASTTANVLRIAHNLANAARRGVRRWLPLPWDEPALRLSAATPSDR